jgi:hypothetical protein
MFRFLLFFLVSTQIAFANTGTYYSLVFGIFGFIWMIFYIPTEGLIYKSMKVKKPFYVSFKINLFSAIIGVLLSIPLAGFAWLERPSFIRHHLQTHGADKPSNYADMYLSHFNGQLIVIIIYFLTSVALENYRYKKIAPNSGLNLKKIFIANSVSYLALIGIWYFSIVKPIKKIVHDFNSGTIEMINSSENE